MQTVLRWLSCLTLTVVASKVTAVESNGILNPPAEGVVEVFPVGAVSIDGQELELSIDFTSNISFEYTEDRFIRVFDSETNQQVFSFDPTVSHPSEGSTHLSVQVSSGLLESGKSYYVTADPVFARLADDPWNAGEIVQGAWNFDVIEITDPVDNWRSVPLLEPVAGINGVYPLGEADIQGLTELPLIIETVYPLSFAYTDGRMIRVIEQGTGTEVYSTSLSQIHPADVSKSEKLPAVLGSIFPKVKGNQRNQEEYVSITGVEVFSIDPEPGHPDEGTTRLTINVPVSVLDTEKQYYVVADDIFARIDGEPWNISHIPSGAWPLEPVLGDGATRQIEAVLDLLESGTPPTTNEEFNNSEFGKQQMELLTQSRVKKAHSLALAATDPQPDWFSTKLSENLIVTGPSASHVIDVYKLDIDENVIGQPSFDEMRLEVRIQHGENDFELVPEQYVEEYASINAGKLYVTLPHDLYRGRFIVGLRPKLDDEGQAVLAERWSTVATFEVWPTNPGTISLSQSEVVFPYSNSEPFHNDLVISQEQIAAAVNQKLLESDFVLPLVVRGESLAVGDLVDYKLDTDPYSGKVVSTETINGQTLVLLSPVLFEVYDIVGASNDSLVEQGVIPEFLVYKSGGALTGFDEEYKNVKKTFDEGEAEISYSTTESTFRTSSTSGDKLFKFDGCSAIGTASIAVTPTVQLDPVDIGFTVTAGLQGSKVECGFSAVLGKKINLLRSAGPAALLLEKIMGTALVGYPTGSLKIGYSRSQTNASDDDGFKASMAWTYVKGFDAKTNIDGWSSAPNGVIGDQEIRTGTLGMDIKVVAEAKGATAESLAGRMANWLGIKLDDIKIEASVGGKAGLVLNAANIPAVYNGNGSSIGLIPSVKGEIKASAVLKKVAKFFGFKGDLSLSIEYKFDVFKGGNNFSGNIISDDGRHSVVGQFNSNSDFLDAIFPSMNADYAHVAPTNTESSVYNDIASSVFYSRDECEASSDGHISAPVIACMGPYCGKTQELSFCSFGDIIVDDLLGVGYVGEEGKFHSQAMLVGTGDSSAASATFSDTLFTLEQNQLDLMNDIPESISGTAFCHNETVYYGTFNAYADVGQDNPSEPVTTKKSMLLCTPGSKETRNVVWGSPHLTTADGLAYDYYASGDYVLSREVGGNELEVQARFLPGMDVSWPQAVAMKVGDDIVEIFAGSAQDYSDTELPYDSPMLVISVNGNDFRTQVQSYNKDGSIFELPGGGYIAIDQNMYRFQGTVGPFPLSTHVIWPLESGYKQVVHVKTIASIDEGQWLFKNAEMNPIQIQITRDPETIYEGMLGNNDGYPSNDLARRSGEVLNHDDGNLPWSSLYGLFGGDWLVRPQECLFTLGCSMGMQFPELVPIPDAANRILAEIACDGLTGYYYDACIHDVGLTGDPDFVKEFYENTEDLNYLSDLVTVPEGDIGLYDLSFGSAEYDPDNSSGVPVYTRQVDIELVGGGGEFLLIAKPPRDATILFSNGETMMRGQGNINTSFTLDCRVPDPLWAELDPELWPVVGSVQLWAIDPLSGATDALVEELPVSCGPKKRELPDTGMHWCFSFNELMPEDCELIGPTGQDAEFGRDNELRAGRIEKIGSGIGSMDYTKIGNNGEELPIEAEDWSCVRDNLTGLMWERKRSDTTSIHYAGALYSWLNTDPTTNGGVDGFHLTDPYMMNCNLDDCNTENFINTINAQGLCGYSDWRLPTVTELASLGNVGNTTFGTGVNRKWFDYEYFIEGQVVEKRPYWTSQTFFPANAFAYEYVFPFEVWREYKGYSNAVILVREENQ